VSGDGVDGVPGSCHLLLHPDGGKDQSDAGAEEPEERGDDDADA
jgi:hypothetical protein